VENMYGAGTGTIWLDDIQCTGTESDIGSCRHADWGVENCGHSEDVSISCLSTTQTSHGKNKHNHITFDEHVTNVHACSGRGQIIRCSNVT